MNIEITPQQAALTLEALRHQLSNMEGLHRRLVRSNPGSLRILAIALEITNLRLAISAVGEAIGQPGPRLA
jgi:hypothetical protein